MGNWVGTVYLGFIIVLGIIGVWAVYRLAKAIIYLVYMSFGFNHKKELNKLSNEQLEGRVFRFEKAYFDYIGHDHSEVKQFKEYIENKDIKSIKSNWSRLESKFRDYERLAGWTGRPYIFEFYCMYNFDVAELDKRT